MHRQELSRLLERVRRGETSVAAALAALKDLPFADLGFAKVDRHRALRRGFPEVIFCQGKTTAQIVKIARTLRGPGGRDGPVLATRAAPAVAAALRRAFPQEPVTYNRPGRAVIVGRPPRAPAGAGAVALVTAGTADIPVAEEARATLAAFGVPVRVLYDAGVAGLHRLLGSRKDLEGAAAVIVVAGMEGALASVVGGLVDCPVIAVPTSIGYGAAFGGLAALLTMLNSCAGGVTVVNIDNGFGAAYAAALIARPPRRG